MRLLVVTQYFWPENFRINDLVAELHRRGHSVTVLTGYPNYPGGALFPEFKANAKRFANYQGVEVIRAPLITRGAGSLRLMVNYFSFALSASVVGLKRLRKQHFDAIFVFEPSPITVGLPAIVLRAAMRTPLAFWVLDLWPQTLQAIGIVRKKLLLRAVGELVTFIYNRCDLILAQSRSFVPQIAQISNGKAAIEYFPSWAEAVFDLAGVAPAPEVPPEAGSFDVVFAGNIGDAQDFPAILAAAEQVKDRAPVRWLIVGDGRMAGWVAQEIARRGLQRQVLMLGRFPVDRMASFYKHARALLVSLKDEPVFSMTIPGKLQSYLAAGVPVIAMLNGEGAEVIRRTGAGLTCRAGDSAGLASAVMTMAALSDQEIGQMADNARRASEAEFDRNRLISWLEARLHALSRTQRA